ncbi:MAG: sigma-70 family RNA polymerase sigma factor [Ruminiclostridium sp.]|nr:sigma-70 family RNA polymerase sigma factor [Ruminiclostridium sp.]
MAEVSSEQIYLEYRSKVAAYISSHIRNREDAEDLVSEVFMKVHSSIDKFDENKASVSTWIYTITRNTVTDFLRRNRVSEELPEDAPSPLLTEESYINEETLSELADALTYLEDEERRIIALRYGSGRPLTEIADKLGISYGAVKIRHRKALSKLEELMKNKI